QAADTLDAHAVVEHFRRAQLAAAAEFPQDIFCGQKVEQIPTAGAQHAANLCEDGEVFGVFLEVAERREEVRDSIEAPVGKGMPPLIGTHETGKAFAAADDLRVRLAQETLGEV